MEFGVLWISEEGAVPSENAIIADKVVVELAIELVVTVDHFFDSHHRMNDVRVLHTYRTEVAHQLIVASSLIKLLECFGVS